MIVIPPAADIPRGQMWSHWRSLAHGRLQGRPLPSPPPPSAPPRHRKALLRLSTPPPHSTLPCSPYNLPQGCSMRWEMHEMGAYWAVEIESTSVQLDLAQKQLVGPIETRMRTPALGTQSRLVAGREWWPSRNDPGHHQRSCSPPKARWWLRTKQRNQLRTKQRQGHPGTALPLISPPPNCGNLKSD